MKTLAPPPFLRPKNYHDRPKRVTAGVPEQNDRAFATLEIKAVDEDERIIEGIASTPTPDRSDDIVEPKGASFELPMPFLWQHQVGQPIGQVISAKVTDAGISVRIQVARSDQPQVKAELDRAWEYIKLGLVRGLSIGFHVKEWNWVAPDSYGMHIVTWAWYELSAVTIPANAEATIQTIKSIDTELRQSLRGHRKAVPRSSPAVAGQTDHRRNPLKLALNDQVKDYEATRAAKAARMEELMAKAAEAGTTLDQEQEQEYDDLEKEVEGIDKHLVRLRKQEKAAAAAALAAAVPAKGGNSEEAAATRGGIVIVKDEKLEPGIEFARFAMCMVAAKGSVPHALALAQTHYPKQVRMINVLKAVAQDGRSMQKYIDSAIRTKAAVSGASTTDAGWAGNLLEYNTYLGDFIEFLRPATILGKFGQNGVPDLRRIPFNVHIKGQNAGGAAYWVGQGKAKPVTKFGFSDAYHGFFKVATIAVLDEEIIRFSDPSAERLVRDSLAEVAIAKLDATFIDPAVAAVANVSPASVTNGVSAIASSGDTADDVRTDLQALWADAIAGNLPLTGAVYITTPSIALALSLMVTSLGQREFPDIEVTGGKLRGVPVIVSNHVPAGTFVLAFSSEIYFSDDGQATIDASREAAIEMSDAPTGDSVTPTAAQLVSMFQTDSVALRMHRYANWSKRRSIAVSLLDSVGWGGAVSS